MPATVGTISLLRLFVRGVEMLDGTPILDIKPYLSSVPPQDLRRGWLDEAEAAREEKSVAFIPRVQFSLLERAGHDSVTLRFRSARVRLRKMPFAPH
jgi:hypothetical protein